VRSLVNESITQTERKASYGKLILRKEPKKKTEEESKLMKKRERLSPPIPTT
jgi:hypothetical protein